MKLIIIVLIFAFTYIGCKAQRFSNAKADSMNIDYVDLFTTTPYDVKVDSFQKHFGKSVKHLVFTDSLTIENTYKVLDSFFKSATKVKKQPDTRLIVSFFEGKNKKIVVMSLNLISYNDEIRVLDDRIRNYFGVLTKNNW